MKILIVGAGAVGGYLAASLAEAGEDVSILARREHGRAIADHGLTLEGAKSLNIKIPVSETAMHFAPLEVVFLATKRTGLEAALSGLIPSVGPKTVFVTLQNGLDADELCRTVFPSTPVIGGIAYIDSWIARPGVIGVGSSARLALESNHKWVCGALERSSVSVNIPGDFKTQRWSKLAWNVICNPLCLITRCTVGEIRANPDLMKIAGRVLKELDAVAKAEGVTLPPKTFDAALGKVKPKIFNAQTRTSMWADYKAGKKTEIDFLNGAISLRGKKHGISTPFNDTLVALVHALEESNGRKR